MSEGRATFLQLNVPQLLKHALGLQRGVPESASWHLRYLYLDTECPAQPVHAGELARFIEAVGDELRFAALSYQERVSGLGAPGSQDDLEYRQYVTQRYFA